MTAILIDAIIKSSVILCFTLSGAALLRRQSAALRHTVWTVGLLCSIAIPIFSMLLPVWHVAPIRAVQHSETVSASQPVVTPSEPATVVAPAAVPAPPNWLTPERAGWMVWLLGVLAVASLLLREAIRLARIAFGSSTVRQTSWCNLAQDVSNALRLTRHVRLIWNPNASVLGTWGALRPRVLLPRESESWSNERMRVVLGHELAHVKRNDWLVQVTAEIARAIYWFNPLFWIACTQLRRESEHACDDTALMLGANRGIDGPTYASHVLDLARTLKHSGQPGTAALAMASPSNLERRLVAMLNQSLNRSATSKRTAVVVVLLGLALTLPLAAMQSQNPVPAVSSIQAIEFVPQVPPAAITTTPAVVQRTLPRAAVVATASPAAFVEAVQPAAAQNQGGTLSGTIMDQSGGVIRGARITMTAQSTGTILRTLSNETGNYAFTQLPPDTYSGTVNLPDFKDSKFSYVLSVPGTNARLNVVLQLGLTTIVDVNAQSPPGLKCFSVFGAVKADGTPFTEADCPGGTAFVPPPKPPVATAPEPATPEVVSVNAPPAAIPAPGQRPIRVGGVVQAGRLLSHPNPAYPVDARNRGIEGVVILSGLIAEDGRVRSLKVISSSNPLLETSVLETLQNWIYAPTLLNGAPVEVGATITVNFTLGR